VGGQFPLFKNGLYAFTVEAWPDLFRSWAGERKVDAGREVHSELLEGAALLASAAERAAASGAAGSLDASRLREAGKQLRPANRAPRSPRRSIRGSPRRPRGIRIAASPSAIRRSCASSPSATGRSSARMEPLGKRH